MALLTAGFDGFPRRRKGPIQVSAIDRIIQHSQRDTESLAPGSVAVAPDLVESWWYKASTMRVYMTDEWRS